MITIPKTDIQINEKKYDALTRFLYLEIDEYELFLLHLIGYWVSLSKREERDEHDMFFKEREFRAYLEVRKLMDEDLDSMWDEAVTYFNNVGLLESVEESGDWYLNHVLANWIKWATSEDSLSFMFSAEFDGKGNVISIIGTSFDQ